MSRDRVIIVACGPSVAAVRPRAIKAAGAFIIAINHAVLKVSANAFFTCDPNHQIRRLLRNQFPGVEYYAAVPDDYGNWAAKCQAHRWPRDANVNYLRRLTGNGPLGHLPGLSEEQGAIHTGNSAYGALGLAYLMGARKVAFLGLDGGRGYGFGMFGNPGPLDHLPSIFESAVPQLRARGVEVMNGSPESAVTCFPRCTPKEALKWIS